MAFGTKTQQGTSVATAPAPVPNSAPSASEVVESSKAANSAPAVKEESKPKETEVLDLSFIGSAVMLAPELAEQAAPTRARSEKQTAMDTKVSELHAAWIKAEKPNTWDKMVAGKTVATYFTEPDKSAELHKLINRSVAFHGLRARFGTPFKANEKLVERYGLPANYLGREVISFAIMDKRPRATSDGKSAKEVVTK